jgi:type 1 fimbria pilin
MSQLFPNRMMLSALAVLALFVCAGRAEATDISGHITTTVTITDDSQLVGDVTCTVPLTASGANPCIAFGADHINLRLNGHTIMGPVDAPIEPNNCTFPTDSMFGVGILANGRTDVISILPGDRRTATFRRQGVQRQLVCLLTE